MTHRLIPDDLDDLAFTVANDPKSSPDESSKVAYDCADQWRLDLLELASYQEDKRHGVRRGSKNDIAFLICVAKFASDKSNNERLSKELEAFSERLGYTDEKLRDMAAKSPLATRNKMVKR